MRRFAGLTLTLGVLWGCFNSPATAQDTRSDDQIRQDLIDRSISRYSGSCPCPYSVNRTGRTCGASSAYSKPGGAEPLCYGSDISDEMIARVRGTGPEPTSEISPAESNTLPTPKAASEAESGGGTVTLERVIDGDTFVLDSGERVRLLLIDTPETSQAGGDEATTWLRRLLGGAGTPLRLELDVQERDRYGRILAHAYTQDGRHVNEEMVKMGYAVVSVNPPNVKHVERLRSAQELARTERRGFWSRDLFECMPAEHRRGECE